MQTYLNEQFHPNFASRWYRRSTGTYSAENRTLTVLYPSWLFKGIDLWYRLPDLRVAHMHYHLRLHKDWPTSIHDTPGMKLPGLVAIYDGRAFGGRKPTESQPDSSMRLFTRGTRIGMYLYHLGQKDDRYGDLLYFTKPGLPLNPNRGPHVLRLQPGRWYCIQTATKMNRPSRSNGWVKAWVDGEPVMERRKLRLRTESSKGVNNMWLDGWRVALRSAFGFDVKDLQVTSRRIDCPSH